MPRTSKAQRELAIINRRKQVASLYHGTMSYREIAEAVGCSLGTVAGDVNALLEEAREQAMFDIEQGRTIQQGRYDRLLGSIWVAALSGSLPHINTALVVMDKMNGLHGYNRPVVTKLVGGDPDAGEKPVRVESMHRSPDLSKLSTEELAVYLATLEKLNPVGEEQSD